MALEHNDVEIIRAAIGDESRVEAARKSVSTRDSDSRTALHWACTRGLVDLTIELLNLGADMLTEDDAGYTPLHSACACGQETIVKVLLQHAATIQPKNSPEPDRPMARKAARLSKAATPGVNAQTTEAQLTPLHYAASKGSESIVNMLLDAGARINAKDKYGATPAMRAAVKGHTQILKVLLDRGAKFEVENQEGNNVLHVACESDIESSAVWLWTCSKGSELRQERNKEGLLPQELATENLRNKLRSLPR